MSRLMLLILPLVLGSVNPSPTRRSLESEDAVVAAAASLDPVFSFTHEEASLNEMFREVEELMEDTQSKLQNAVKEMEAEEVAVPRAAPNYHNESVTETTIGNKTVQTHQDIVKETDNITGATMYSETVITSVKSQDKKSRECIIDEDCESGNYCYFANSEYKCLRCKAEEACTRDGECCDGQLCVWGQCTKSSKGKHGTICESQQDCSPGLCCAVQTSLLFPVCTPLPLEGELCHDPTSQLLDLISWELEPDGVLDLCLCPSGLICQPRSHGLASVCEQLSLNETRRDQTEIPVEDLPFLPLFPKEEFDYEEVNVMPAMYEVEASPSEHTYSDQPGIVPELPFEDGI
ncbi:hypothetical protein FKM82_003240 [Ascaphus truei]